MYIGSRKQDFKKLIEKLLKIGGMNKNSIENLLDDESMEVYSQVFTHPSVNEELNYEAYELAGDVTLNKANCVVFLEKISAIKLSKRRKSSNKIENSLRQQESFF